MSGGNGVVEAPCICVPGKDSGEKEECRALGEEQAKVVHVVQGIKESQKNGNLVWWHKLNMVAEPVVQHGKYYAA